MKFCPPAASPLLGRFRLPGDKSITHRALMFAALGDGPCRIGGHLDAADTRSTLNAVKALGVTVARVGNDLLLAPVGFPEPGDCPGAGAVLTVDCGNSGTTARLLLGLLAGRDRRVHLDGDDSLRRRPMARVVEPLRKMGASLAYDGEEGRLPITVLGGRLHGIKHEMDVPSAQVKSALMLAALTAEGDTTIRGGGLSRDHTERMLAGMGADLDRGADEVTLKPGPRLRARDVRVPGDPSSAAFLLAAAALVPGSEVGMPDVSLNETRAGFLKVMERMGVDLSVKPDDVDAAEPFGDVTVRFGPLRACTIGGAEIPTLIDELPVLAVLAARADGVTTIQDAADLRTKESDRIAAVAAGLRALGVEVEERPDGMVITGRPDWGSASEPVSVTTHGDHRIAMAFAVAGLASAGGVNLDDAACVDVSFPDFFTVCEELQKAP